MASDRPSQPAIPEEDKFEAEDNVEREDPDICESKNVDPSQPGWEITLHFFGEDPKKGNPQLTKDFSMLRSLESIGILTMEYIPKGGNNTIVLSHKEESPSQHFIRDYRELFDRYSPLVKAPMSARRVVSAEDKPETIRPPSSGPPASDVVARVAQKPQKEVWKVLRGAEFQPTLEKPAKKKEAPQPSVRQKIEQFAFDSIITTIPFDHPYQERIREDLQRACEGENLEYEEQEDATTNHYDIIMSKKDEVSYTHSMKVDNLSMIFNTSALHKLALTFF